MNWKFWKRDPKNNINPKKKWRYAKDGKTKVQVK